MKNMPLFKINKAVKIGMVLIMSLFILSGGYFATSIFKKIETRKQIEQYIVDVGEANLEQQEILIKLEEEFMNEKDSTVAVATLQEDVLPNMESFVATMKKMEIKNTRLKEIHSIYVDSVSAQLAVIQLYEKGIQENDAATIMKTNEKIEDINKTIAEYESALVDFAAKHGFKVNNPTKR